MITELGLAVGLAWVVVWGGFTSLFSDPRSKGRRAGPSGPALVAASGFGTALVLILLEAVGTAATAARGMYIVLIATSGAMAWVAVACMPRALPSWPPKLHGRPRAGRAIGPASGPLAFALGLVLFAGMSPVDMVDWTTTHLTLGAILGGCIGWVAFRWARPGHVWSGPWPVGPARVVARPRRPESKATPALIQAFQERWVADRRATGSADRSAAEASVDVLYAERGLAPPDVRIWLRSPHEMAVALPLIDDLCRRLAGGAPFAAAWDRAGANTIGIDPTVIGAIAAQLADRRSGATGSDDRARSATFARVDVVPPAREPDRASIGRWAAGERAAPLDRLLQDQLELDGSSRAERSEVTATTRHVARAAEFGCLVAIGDLWSSPAVVALGTLAESCDGWRSFDGLSVFQDRPTAIHLDPVGRIHADDGPAIRYADGWGVWAIHGLVVPRAAVESPGSLTFEEVRAASDRQRRVLIGLYGDQRYRVYAGRSAELIVAEPDPAMRRLLIDDYGPERYVQAVGEIVQQDTDGLGHPRRLWRAVRPGDDPLVMVEVRNSTPEPDGSRRVYWLRVPPSVRDCQAAVAWTFGITADEFALTAEA